MEDITVKKATVYSDYCLNILFSDGTKKVVDFFPFLNSTDRPVIKEYLEQDKFNKFKIEDGNIVWGKDWDLIFPVDQLYNGEIIL